MRYRKETGPSGIESLEEVDHPSESGLVECPSCGADVPETAIGRDRRCPFCPECGKPMTDEQLNIAVCEWRGWKCIRADYDSDGELTMWRGYWDEARDSSFLPSHITGIEALGNMHEAEKGLSDEQHKEFRQEMRRSTNPNAEAYFREYVSADARQRAIALLRVVRPGLFIEEAK